MPDYKVLIPLDGSRVAEHALVYVEALRALGESKVRLLSVVDESEDFHALNTTEAREREVNLLSTYLREVAADLHTHAGVEVETKVVCGPPGTSVLAEAQEYKPDLLMISSHGRSGVARWRIGSVADKVIRGASCNVLVVGPRATANEAWIDTHIMPPFRSVLVPLDGSALAEKALEVARRISTTYGSTLHLVRAVTVPVMADGMGSEAMYAPQLLDAMVDGARDYVAQVAQKLGPSIIVKTEVELGAPAILLADYATAHDIDLIVMTTHGRGGLARTALGSVTDRLLGSPAPVLVVRASPA